MVRPARRPLFLVVFAALASLLLPRPVRADELADRIEKIIRGSDYRHARWGILVIDPANREVVYEHNPDQLFAPASVTKLYSCAAAFLSLGPDYRFETPVYRRGRFADGVLAGDLILRARGDLTLGGRTTTGDKMAFTSDDHIYATPTGTDTALTDTNPLAGLESLARQVKDSGVREVSGEILIDDRLFDTTQGSGSGPRLLTPILVNDNVVDVVVTPADKAGDKATWKLRPQTDFVRVDVQVDTADKKASTQVRVERVGPQAWTVRGRIPVGGKPAVRVCVVDDPVGFARALFIDELRRAGVTVRASGLRPARGELPPVEDYSRLERVALLRSPPLSEALKVTLKVSHNLYASTLPLLLAVQKGQRTLREGMLQQGKALAELGVDVKTISLDSGAGGGDADRVSPRVTVDLLLALMKRPDFPVFKDALPVLGVDGTLTRTVAKDSPARGKVFAKTGTYTDTDLLNGRTHLRAKSVAGVLTTAGGRTLAFAIFVNDVSLPSGVTSLREGKVIGRLCEILVESAP
jgi:D-alanyl-D-alanine carboxypeptidase/D-alanyl-D-alanine-endopeptidase (penicillin-binding protein 4)